MLGRFSAKLGPETPPDRRGSSCSAGCTTNLLRRQLLRPFRRHVLVLPDSRLHDELWQALGMKGARDRPFGSTRARPASKPIREGWGLRSPPFWTALDADRARLDPQSQRFPAPARTLVIDAHKLA